jgi:hypothetical protein
MFEGEVAHRLVERLRLSRWLGKLPPRLVWASFVFVNGFLSVAILAGLALVSHTPFVFPSVGPTAFMLYFTTLAPTASPRNTLCGHALGIACGYASLWLVGLEHAPSAILEELHWRRVLAAAFSLAASGALMVLLGVVHAKSPLWSAAVEKQATLKAQFVAQRAPVPFPPFAKERGAEGGAIHLENPHTLERVAVSGRNPEPGVGYRRGTSGSPGGHARHPISFK